MPIAGRASHNDLRWLRRDVARPTSREAEVDSCGLELKQEREDWNAHFIFKDGIFQALVACRRRAFLEAPRCDRASNFLDLQGRSDAK